MPSIADKAGLGPIRRVREVSGGYCVEVQIPTWAGNYPPREVYLTTEQYEGYLRWRNGESIQFALPDLTDEQREVLMNGDPEFGDE